MQWTIPGTVLAAQTEDAEKIRDVFNAFFLAGNISLSQVSAISGLEPYMIQNWVRRKYLSNSQGKKYSLDQLCRILTINLLRKSMSIDKVCDLLSYVNGQLDESGDDLIADAELYFLLVSLAAQVYGRKGTLEEGIEKSVRQLQHQPGAVAGFSVSPDRAAMFQISQDLNAFFHQSVRRFCVQINNKTYSAAVMIVFRIIQAQSAGIARGITLKKGGRVCHFSPLSFIRKITLGIIKLFTKNAYKKQHRPNNFL